MSALKKAGSKEKQVSFRGDHENGSSTTDSVSFLTRSVSTSDRSTGSDRSSSTMSIPDLHLHLMRTQKKKDPFKYYEVLKVLGDGSMGSVCKVKKKKSAVGGSARKTFLERQKRNSLLQMLPCLSICLPGDATEETKKGALVSANGYNVDYLTGSTRGNSSSPSVGSRSSKPQNPKTLTKKSSSMISYMDDYGVVYALKSIILDQVTNAIFVRELQNEIALLRTLDHPNICKAIETYDFKKQLYLVLELCSGGDLYSRDPYDESNARYIVHSILDACTYMHKKNITHRDLKYENIMFASPTSQHVKIIDFGLSKKYLDNQHLHQTVGTVYTMAPEVIKGDYGELCDVWSIGVLAFMLLSSSLPFFGKSRNDVVKKIMYGKFFFKARRWKEISPEAKDFVTSLLVKDVNHRPSCHDALTHDWFKGRNRAHGSEILSPAIMDRVQATIKTFAGYTKLKKLALYVIAHKSSDDEIGFLQQLFQDRFDLKEDGVISLEEFKEALSVYSYTDNELETIFYDVDIDGGDCLSYSEFLAATIEVHGPIEEDRVAEAFDRLDNDDTGYITVSNLTDFLGDDVPREFIDEIIDEADVSHDHRIDYDEFLRLWEGDFDAILEKNLKDVRAHRLVRESGLIQGLEEGEDGEFLEEKESEETNGVGEKDISLELAPPGAGKYFFDVEKEKSMRAVWI